jgi:hypothetical protein
MLILSTEGWGIGQNLAMAILNTQALSASFRKQCTRTEVKSHITGSNPRATMVGTWHRSSLDLQPGSSSRSRPVKGGDAGMHSCSNFLWFRWQCRQEFHSGVEFHVQCAAMCCSHIVDAD